MNQHHQPPPGHPANTPSGQPQVPPNQSRFPPRNDMSRMVGVAQYFPSAKPFDPVTYTEDEFIDIQTSLDKTLGPEYVSSRPGGGGTTVAYLEGWKALNIANEIFGFNGWSSELVGYTLDFCDVLRDGRISMGLSVVVRVTIKDGTYHEDIGYGYIDNAKNKAAAYEKCKKEALTDGVKRCLRCFGNVLGNCLYDKALTSKLRGIPKQKTDLEENNLYRDDTIMKMRENRRNTTKVNIMEADSFGSDMQMDMPLKAILSTRQLAPPPVLKPTETPKQKEPINTPAPPATAKKVTPSQDEFDDSFLFSDDVEANKIDDYEMEMIMNKSNKENEDPDEDITPPTTDIPPDTSVLPLFVSAKKADLLKSQPSAAIPEFDPKFVSPNIRRTLDPTKSVPVRRTEVKPLESRNEITPSQTPSKPAKRMIGMPPTTRLKRQHNE